MNERTADSLLRGLRYKFTLEATKTPNKTYTPLELSTFLRGIMVNLDQKKINEYHPEDYVENQSLGNLGEQIEKSTIKRYNWEKFLGTPSTKIIHKYRNEGFTQKQTFEAIASNYNLSGFLEQNPYERDKMLKNLKISVSARFIESRTAEKVLEEGI